MDTPAVKDIEHIASISDPVVRNLNITQCYHELSHGMAGLTGIKPNWCTFAVWASRQAGQSIRKEDLIRTFEYYFRHSPEVVFMLENISNNIDALKNLPEVKTIRESVLKIIDTDAVFEKSGKAVAAGNKKVFEEIGKEFARFFAFFKDDKDFTEKNINNFCAALRPGNPPDGQQLLRDAFTAYYEARLLTDPKEKAEKILYANLLIGFHEQTRLQPEITEALNAASGDRKELRYKIFKLLLPGYWFRIRYFLAGLFNIKLPLDEILDDILNIAERQMREVITRFMMSLNIPGSAVLRFGNDLQIRFPEILKKITNQKLKELLVKIDPTPDSLKESGTKDWGDFDDRIHFIADFFRSYHTHNHLFITPFSEEQVLIFKAGTTPRGDL